VAGGWSSKSFPPDTREQETERIASNMAETDPVHLMKAKRTTNRQLEFMGFKTAMAWSMDVHSSGGGGRRGMLENMSDFWRISGEEGLRAAFDWRDTKFGIEYKHADEW